MPTIKFVNEKKSIDVPAGTNLRKAALRHGVPLYSGVYRYLNCRGNGVCTSCRVLVKSEGGNLSRPGWWERLHSVLNPLHFFSRIGREKDLRLACRAEVHGDCEIETRPPMNWSGEKFWS